MQDTVESIATDGHEASSRFVHVDPDLTINSAYLLNVAEVLKGVITADVSGATRARITESAEIITRVAHAILAVAENTASTRRTEAPPASEWLAASLSEGVVIDASEAKWQALTESRGTPGSAAPGPVFDQDKLESYLREHLPDSAGLNISESRVVPGGRSKQTILFRQEGAHDIPTDLVIRRDWASAVTGTSVVSEFALLRVIADAGLKVPRPILLEPTSSPLGTPFMVMPRIAGQPYGDMFHPMLSEGLALDIAEQLGKLHSLPLDALEASGVPTDAYTPEQLTAGLAKFRAFQGKIGLRSQTIAIGLDWMERTIPAVTGDRAMVHNDLGCHNFLIQDERLNAILDWEIATISNPAADLGYIRGFIEQMTSWPRFMAAYREAGGPEIAPLTLDFYQLWSGIRLCFLLLQARAGVAAGMVRDTEITYACASFIPQLVTRLSKELRRILANPSA